MMADDSYIDWKRLAEIREALANGNLHGALTALDAFIKEKPQCQPKSEEEQVKDARWTVQRDYEGDVENIANDLKARWENGDFDGDCDAFQEAIREDVEGTQRVIYTAQAMDAVTCSKNGDYGITEGLIQLDTKEGIPWSALAFYAMEQDVIEELDRIGIDTNEDPPAENTRKCSECNEYKDRDAFQEKQCNEGAGLEPCNDCDKWFKPEMMIGSRCKGCATEEEKRP